MSRVTSSHGNAETHERVRQAALELFTQKGYQSTSLRDLASYLGMQAGSLYNHMENKQSLLYELMEEALDDLLVNTRTSVKQGNTRDERLRLFVQASLDFQRRERKRMTLINREMINLSTEQQEHIKSLVEEYARCLKSVIAGQSAKGPTVNHRSDLLIGAIIGMLQGLHFWDSGEAPSSSRDEVDQLTSIISGAISAAVA
ncbi:TetR/AcrR family transcriptional regulator [Pseudomonas capeferrum]|uniref:TetR/AcrR family transcriptional regulator n=1 Tax=Pseudomonas capeferrum TaxID=1495066 RepID=UPI0015E28A2D|nr:TetR/AcrR family transcriptional regulator [Pseudomonas capeferrum]MBA1204378.1 TetR/AcrR family transcriptional regulator [Pseudomonas capeferrum]